MKGREKCIRRVKKGEIGDKENQTQNENRYRETNAEKSKER